MNAMHMPRAAAVLTSEPTVLNGNPALVLYVDGEFDGVLAARVQDGLITGMYIVRNPNKLTRVSEETTLSLR